MKKNVFRLLIRDFIERDLSLPSGCGQQTRTRKIKGLLEAMEALKINRAEILTADTQEEIEADGKAIQVTPLWKWLLSGGEHSDNLVSCFPERCSTNKTSRRRKEGSSTSLFLLYLPYTIFSPVPDHREGGIWRRQLRNILSAGEWKKTGHIYKGPVGCCGFDQGLTMTTLTGDLRATFSEVEPRRILFTPFLPWAPTTTRSGLVSSR